MGTNHINLHGWWLSSSGRWLKERDLLAIYRIHDPSDTTLAEFIDTSVARFSQSPGRHVSQGLEPYCRVTSPLRRLEDFVMNGLLKVYAAGDRNVVHVMKAE